MGVFAHAELRDNGAMGHGQNDQSDEETSVDLVKRVVDLQRQVEELRKLIDEHFRSLGKHPPHDKH